MKPLALLLCVLLSVGGLFALAPATAHAQFQQPVPPESATGTKPTPTYPEPRGQVMRLVDLAVFVLALGLATWVILKTRSRRWVVALLIGAVLYFGFYRGGCVCPIGATQNVTQSLADLGKPAAQAYTVSLVVVAFFVLPLVLALFAGRVFCGGVCWLGAGQDLLLRMPVRLPLWLDKPLRYLRWAYLAAVLFWAAGGLPWLWSTLAVKRRYLICEYDPFVNIFRSVNVRAALAGDWANVFQFVGPWWMWVVTGGLLLSCLFIGRPYCRWICPYGALLGTCSRTARRGVTVQPDECCDCGLCENACPFGAIEDHAAVNAFCVACARCYKACPLERERLGLDAPDYVGKALAEAPAEAPPTPARTPAARQPIRPAEDEVDVDYVRHLVELYGRDESAALPILQYIQTHHRYLPRQAMQMACNLTDLTMAQLTGLSTFYNQFRLAPIGKHLVCVCHGTACHVAGADRISDALRLHLNLGLDEDTDRRRDFTLQKVACLGCCSLAPCMQVDGVTYGHLKPDTAVKAIESIRDGKVASDKAAHRPLTDAEKPGCEHAPTGIARGGPPA